MNCCLTKQKLLIELMHLRVVIDRAMSLSKCLAARRREREEAQEKGMKDGLKKKIGTKDGKV